MSNRKHIAETANSYVGHLPLDIKKLLGRYVGLYGENLFFLDRKNRRVILRAAIKNYETIINEHIKKIHGDGCTFFIDPDTARSNGYQLTGTLVLHTMQYGSYIPYDPNYEELAEKLFGGWMDAFAAF